MASVTSDDGSGQKLLPVVSETPKHQPRFRHQPNRRVISAIERQDSSSDHEDARGGFGIGQNVSRNMERTPLIRPRRSDDLTDDASSVSSVENLRRYGAVPLRPPLSKEPKASRTWRCFDTIATTLDMRSSSVVAFLLIVVVGIVLTFAANIKTDQNGINVKPRHVLAYTMILMTVFMVWASLYIFPQKVNYSSKHNGALIPSHLLTGIGIFGTVTAVSQMLTFLDFLKCSRHVKKLSVVYGIYPFFKAFFVYFQIYFFYKLSREGIRDRKVPGGNFFVMVTLAANMCIWSVVFLDDASSDRKMRNVPWLDHYYFGIKGDDPCAKVDATSPQVKELHDIMTSLNPYIAAFSMEYTLLASGLLLHIWTSMKKPHSLRLRRSDHQEWTLWRIGFICGLLALPLLFIAYIYELCRKKSGAASAFLYGFEGIVYIFLIFLSRLGTIKLNETAGFVKNAKYMPIEVILLGISFVGFPVLDLCCAFASISEVGNFSIGELFWFGVSSVFELIAVGLQFLFIKKAYELKLPEVAEDKVRKTARFIRQFASFALVVNVGHWAAKTYELRRSSGTPNISEKYFGIYAWFALSHVAYPLCIFFHFHLAICYADVIFFFSQFGPLFHAG